MSLNNSAVIYVDPSQIVAMWSTLLIGNLTAAVACICLLFSLCTVRTRAGGSADAHRVTAKDIFVGYLVFGCLFLSLTWGTHCFLNLVLVATDIYTPTSASCWVEAYCVVWGMMNQFLGVALVALSNYVKVLCKPQHGLGMRSALLLVIGISSTTMLSAYGIATASGPVELMSSSISCVFPLDSPLMLYWVTPLMLLSLAASIFCYIRVWMAAVDSATTVAPMTNHKNAIDRKAESIRNFARSSWLFVLLYVVGWGPTVVLCIISTSSNLELRLLPVIILVVCGTLHTIAVPFAYGLHLRRCRMCLFGLGCCVRCWQHLYRHKDIGGRVVVVTATPVGTIKTKRPRRRQKEKKALIIPDTSRAVQLPGLYIGVELALTTDAPGTGCSPSTPVVSDNEEQRRTFQQPAGASHLAVPLSVSPRVSETSSQFA